MNISVEIMKFANNQKSPFKRRDVRNYLNSYTEKVAESSVSVTLNRLVASGKLDKVGYGVYSLSSSAKPLYRYMPTEDECLLAKSITKKFPFTKYCVWRPTVLVSFMQHIPAVTAVFVDVERVALDSMLAHLQQMNLDCQILLNPTKQECDRYVTNEKIVVIRPLVCEAPIETNDGVPVPLIEKMLVDAAGDQELSFAQGNEIYSMFANAMERYEINRSRMLRYASRRNRKPLIEEILANI